MKVNQIQGLNRQARKFLLEHCVSKRGVEIMAYGFTGYINSNEVEDVTLIRLGGKWEVFRSHEPIFSVNGNVEFFVMTENTIR